MTAVRIAMTEDHPGLRRCGEQAIFLLPAAPLHPQVTKFHTIKE